MGLHFVPGPFRMVLFKKTILAGEVFSLVGISIFSDILTEAGRNAESVGDASE